MKPLVIYHANCTDGFGAAFAAWAKLGDSAEYLPMHYSDDPLKDVIYEDRDVYMLDFSVPRHDTEHLLNLTSKFVWLDHHKTAFEMWTGGHPDSFTQTEFQLGFDDHPRSCHIYLDQHRSGAYLAWEYFHPATPVPKLIRLIDDRDRWQFKLPESKAFHAGINDVGFDFHEWARAVPYLGGSSDRLDKIVRNGQTILNVYARQIRESVSKAEQCRIVPAVIDSVASYQRPWTWRDNQCGASGLAANSPIHQSEIGNALAQASGTFGMVWYYDSATKRANVSLRSIGDYDVSAIAKVFGGGGHKNAAGFNVPMAHLLEWL